MRQLCKSETKSRARITVKKFSQPHKLVFISGYANRGKKLCFYCFYKLTFPRQNAKFFVMAVIKRKILTSHAVLYTKSCMCNQFLFCKKDTFQNTDFSRLKRQLKRKKLTQHVCKDFPSFSRRREWVNKVKLLRFQLKNFFNFVHA